MLSADVLWARQAAELSPASSESSLQCKSLSQIPGYHKKICTRDPPGASLQCFEKRKQIVQAKKWCSGHACMPSVSRQAYSNSNIQLA
jgi:hypothetical protein